MASLFQFSMYFWYIRIVGVNDAEGPPVPISNTEVKLSRAEDTCLETDRENRSTPTRNKDHPLGWSFSFRVAACGS